MRWYYHCDRLGVLVWQDFVNGGSKYKLTTISLPLITNTRYKDNKYRKLSRADENGRKEAEQEFKDTIKLLYNTPSIVLWTIFNEAWGQFDAARIYKELKQIDTTRIYDHASGWIDQGISETKSMHVYFKRFKMPKEKEINNRAVILSECGGYALKIKKHTFNNTNFDYSKMSSKEALENEYKKLIQLDILPNISKGLCAFIYTQLSDVEDELNGFITYDRCVVKVDKKKINLINNTAKY
jgi:beta-galactosidase/beta-glucuronidase